MVVTVGATEVVASTIFSAEFDPRDEVDESDPCEDEEEPDPCDEEEESDPREEESDPRDEELFRSAQEVTANPCTKTTKTRGRNYITTSLRYPPSSSLSPLLAPRTLSSPSSALPSSASSSSSSFSPGR